MKRYTVAKPKRARKATSKHDSDAPISRFPKLPVDINHLRLDNALAHARNFNRFNPLANLFTRCGLCPKTDSSAKNLQGLTRVHLCPFHSDQSLCKQQRKERTDTKRKHKAYEMGKQWNCSDKTKVQGQNASFPFHVSIAHKGISMASLTNNVATLSRGARQSKDKTNKEKRGSGSGLTRLGTILGALGGEDGTKVVGHIPIAELSWQTDGFPYLEQ
nr:hypothetical protein L203_05455 [Cryptococcus depauperatus CBS 7841]